MTENAKPWHTHLGLSQWNAFQKEYSELRKSTPSLWRSLSSPEVARMYQAYRLRSATTMDVGMWLKKKKFQKHGMEVFAQKETVARVRHLKHAVTDGSSSENTGTSSEDDVPHKKDTSGKVRRKRVQSTGAKIESHPTRLDTLLKIQPLITNLLLILFAIHQMSANSFSGSCTPSSGNPHRPLIASLPRSDDEEF